MNMEEVLVSKGPSALLPQVPWLLQMWRALHTWSLMDDKVLFSSRDATATRYLCIL